jgi:clan AA aspartic protease
VIRGAVTDRLEATIPIHLRAADNRLVEVQAVIDTGFNGHVALPASIIERLALEPLGQLPALLGDGRRVVLAVYDATVVWEGAEREVEALHSDAGALVGMALLHGSELRIGVRPGGPVSVALLATERD